jgi:hypothetical protein
MSQLSGMSTERMIRKVYEKKNLRIVLHIAFWVGLFGIQRYLTTISFNNYRDFPDLVATLLIAGGTASVMLFYYPFVYWVLPRFFYKKRFVTGIAMTLLLVTCYAFADTIVEELVLKRCASCMTQLQASNTGYGPFLNQMLIARLLMKVLSMGTFIGIFFNIGLPLSIKLGLQALRQQFQTAQLTKENLQLEFDFLKSQVNPHFLFNTLNNIYGLILNDEKEKSAGTVARLSQFLRYSLYESNSEKVPVEKEVQLLKDYIALESIRLNCIKVRFTNESDGSVKTIAPLLVLPIIENSFKHTTDETGAYINIDFKIADQKIHFNLQNSLDIQKDAAGIGGIGLNNFNKRLDLYYRDRYTYQVNRTEKQYAVSINIECHE